MHEKIEELKRILERVKTSAEPAWRARVENLLAQMVAWMERNENEGSPPETSLTGKG